MSSVTTFETLGSFVLLLLGAPISIVSNISATEANNILSMFAWGHATGIPIVMTASQQSLQSGSERIFGRVVGTKASRSYWFLRLASSRVLDHCLFENDWISEFSVSWGLEY